MSNILRNIPSVTELLETPTLRRLSDSVSRNVVVSGVRRFLDDMRDEVRTAAEMTVPAAGELAERIARWIMTEEKPPLRPVINATGILLHTGLGRAPLAAEAIDEIAAMATGYASVEVDLTSGERSHRVVAVEKLLQELTGAEAAAVCNNNAGATLLTLAALAGGREVIVSRGQLIEIGGSYRLPDVMAASGAMLREVGTTNKTRIADYESAITDSAEVNSPAALMRVHTSNFKVVGFAEEASLEELVALARKHKIRKLPVIDDIGSGALIDYARYGLEGEPVAAECIKAGADVVLFSGDKLLGGPQCGIVVGRRDLVERITKHPMMRAMRVDKMTLAALAATLRLYRDIDTAEQSIPLLSLLSTSLENLQQRAARMAPQLGAADAIESAEVVEGESYLGGGSVPTQRIGTWCVALKPHGASVDQLAKRLRGGATSVMGRVQQDRLLLDLRSVFPAQDMRIVEAITATVARSDDIDAAEESP